MGENQAPMSVGEAPQIRATAKPGTSWEPPAEIGQAPKHGQTHFDAGILLIAGLPWVILRFDASWLFAYSTSSFGFIDPWIYLGYFLDLTQHLRTFKGAYFSTRLTWTVPGAIVYHLFSPLVAAHVLHLGLFYAATVSLYLILKMTVSRRAALLAALLMGSHSHFLCSVGWDYVDGAALSYLLMTLCSLTFAARAANPCRWLLAAGILAAFAIHAQFFLIVFFPLALGYYLFARRECHQPALPGWRPFAWGLVAVTVLFGLFNMAVNGRFVFFINAMGMAAKLVISNPYTDHSYHWLAQATWLILPILSLLGAILCLRRRERLLTLPNAEFLLFWQRYLVLSVGTMVVLEGIGEPVLQLRYYASYLMPAVFLAFGSQLAIVLDRLSRARLVLLSSCAVAVSLLPYVLPVSSRILDQSRQHPWLLPLALGSFGVVVISCQVRYVTSLALLLACLSLAALTAASGTRTWAVTGQADDAAHQKYAFLTIVDSVHAIQQLDPKGNLYFWYTYRGHWGMLYRAVASTYVWSYRLQSEVFPSVGGKLPPAGRRILIFSEDPEAALLKAEASLRDASLEAKYLQTRTIHEGPYRWYMTEIEVAVPTKERPIGVGPTRTN
jgi:4-amino-4-deoxy-L-arabinose transferase-like glycosyltransferase